MTTSNRTPMIVGIVVLICIFAGLYLLIKVGKLQEALDERQLVQVQFENAQGLSVGAAVLYKGVPFGTVAAVKVIRKEKDEIERLEIEKKQPVSPFQVLLTLNIRKHKDFPVTYDDKITIHVPPALGTPDVRIEPMGGNRLYKSGTVIAGQESLDLFSVVDDIFGNDDNKRDLKESVSEFGDIIENIEIVTSTFRNIVEKREGLLGVLTDKELESGLKTTLTEITTMARSIANLGISDLLSDNKIADRIVDKWWDDNVKRRTKPKEIFEKWKGFVKQQRELNDSLLFSDPKFGDKGPRWKNEKIIEYRKLVAEKKQERDLLEKFSAWQKEKQRSEYEAWKKDYLKKHPEANVKQ